MKKSLWLAFLLIVSVFVASCAQKKEAPAETP